MMDPLSALGIAASASEISAQVLLISDSLYQFFKRVKNAPKLSRELRQEALLLSDVLETLSFVFSSQDHHGSLPKASASLELLNDIQETIMGMADKLEIRNTQLSWERLTWPFTQKQNEKYLEKLERFKSSFQLALQSLQSYFSPMSFPDLSDRSWTVSNVLLIESTTSFKVHIN